MAMCQEFWGGPAIVGCSLPIAAGLALGGSVQENKAVTSSMFGDGASNIGFFHER
jgi:pyruvate dehydrogenase E1 component alpha subunit